MSDVVDKIRGQWSAALPDLDTTDIAVVGRILRLASLIDRTAVELLAEHGLSRPEFDVLCAVRRNGVLNPGQISREMLASGAAITKRLDRLERIGLLVRESDEHDRRVVRVRLTEQGASLIDGLLPRHIATEGAALRELTTRQREQLAHLLSIVLQTVEGIVP